MNIFFDVDYTILSADWGLRRHTVEVFSRLVDDGHQVHVWSGEGKRWKVVKDHGLEPFVTGVFAKPIVDYANGLKRYGVDPIPDFIIDDYPQIVEFFGGYHIKDFYMRRDDDDEIQTVYDVICEQIATGTSTNPRWRARHPEFDAHVAAALAAD